MQIGFRSNLKLVLTSMLDKKAITKALDNCLMTEEDLHKGQDFWENLNDPFPAWEEIN